ncbi:hypothetical protein [Nocardioides sp.]|uniref:hypothetical protein n=1 Tax=Nocardioides sp. TaxID=35761 RepID=UPI0025FFCE20|nr:hypothetical protein [Nocardioides sp.]
MEIDEGLTDRATRQPSVHWALQGSDGATVAVCSQRHGQQLRLVRDEPSLTVRLSQVGEGVVAACSHCGWCGDLVTGAARCAVHAPHGCPEFDAFATEAAKRCVGYIADRLSERDLPETFWHYLPLVARSARESGQLHPAVLAEMMWRTRAAWQQTRSAAPEHR